MTRKSAAVQNDDAVPLVRLRDVHLTFGTTAVLKGISFDVSKGETISIIGPSGTGKSTILRCINGLIVPEQGQIVVNGTDVTALKTEAQRIALRKTIGFVFQQFNLFPHLNVLDNITIAPVRILGRPRDEAETSARELLARVHLGGKEKAFPAQLSGGQQQRVAIARALAMRPDLVLFDEVTSSLDPEMVSEVLAVIKDLVSDGLTGILVTHEMRFAEECSDRILFVEDGRIALDGSPANAFGPQAPARLQAFVRGIRESVAT
ncbi:amino acid ABC transporter ATP-binding protein [Bradyrhizobium sp. SZCCHNPS2010]|uniref:amino acid ABC transporter ATP-binding protein n=1 Tax=Bradyrhizobium sp. SZCCHNPS2010 TaxID=3057333 RepID=UPI002915E56D|nr:amino acid ABC transporter ATP-binding protein [Bradyrhizobium sp. SZCCHNPS2010]